MTSRNLTRGILAVALTVSFQFAISPIHFAQQPATQVTPAAGAPQAGRGGQRGAVDPRVQQRTYTFADTKRQMPYALSVSSKVTKNKKNPLIISLHGLGGDQNTMVRESLRSVELRTWVDTMRELHLNYSYKEYPGLSHGPIMAGSMVDIYAFFAKHSK